MPPETALVLRLQGIDQRIAELKREIAQLPKHIAEIEKQLEQHARRLEANRAALAANQRERKRLEGEIQVEEQKVSKLKDQMLQAKTNEQYRAFQEEITYCEKRIRQFEDKILDLMAESEPLERNVKLAEEELKAEKIEVEKQKAEARARTERDKKELQEQEAARRRLAAELPPALVANYERISKKLGRGNAVAEAVDGRCTGCQMMLRPQLFQDLKLSSEVLYCESCGRILYYNPPVVVDEQAGPQPFVG